MKKRGSTLVEIIIVLAILSTLIAIPIGGNKIIKIMNDITIKSIEQDISNLISLAKHYSYSTGNSGRLEISKGKGEIKFTTKGNLGNRSTIAIVSLPIGYNFLSDFSISVSNKGVVSSDSIRIKDANNEYHKITISVGIDLVNIY